MQLLAKANIRVPFPFLGKAGLSDSLLSSGKERYPVHSEMIVRQACRTEEAGRMAKRIFTAEQDGFAKPRGSTSTDGCGRRCGPGDSKKLEATFFRHWLAMANIQIGDGACRGRQFGRAVFIQNTPP